MLIPAYLPTWGLPSGYIIPWLLWRGHARSPGIDPIFRPGLAAVKSTPHSFTKNRNSPDFAVPEFSILSLESLGPREIRNLVDEQQNLLRPCSQFGLSNISVIGMNLFGQVIHQPLIGVCEGNATVVIEPPGFL
jgi:hypothetical protein